MDRASMMGSQVGRAGGRGKVLEFSVGYSAKHHEAERELSSGRQSWSRRAGVSDQERMLALAFGALLTPAVWLGHSLLVWMHLL